MYILILHHIFISLYIIHIHVFYVTYICMLYIIVLNIYLHIIPVYQWQLKP